MFYAMNKGDFRKSICFEKKAFFRKTYFQKEPIFKKKAYFQKAFSQKGLFAKKQIFGETTTTKTAISWN